MESGGQAVGLGVIVGVASIVVGYLVYLAMPRRHFPATTGLLASNLFIAVLGYFGVVVAQYMLVWWLMASFSLGLEGTLHSDQNSK